MNAKIFHQWAKEVGTPVPKYVGCEALVKGGEGAFLITTVNLRAGFENRVAYLQSLCAAARKAGKYARFIEDHKLGAALVVDLKGDFAQIDIDAQYDLRSLFKGGEIR